MREKISGNIDEKRMILLWQQLIAGDKDSFSEIYNCYFGILYKYGLHFVPDRVIVKDAIQELFIDLWRLKFNLSPTTSVKYYLFRSLRRKLRAAFEEESTFVFLDDTNQYLIKQIELSQEQAVILGETEEVNIKKLQHAIEKLTSRQKEAIRLRYYEEFTLPEVASLMDMNEQSVRNLIQRAIAKLRDLFTSL